MFKNAAIFLALQHPHLDVLAQAADGRQFVSCTPTQQFSIGWVPARGIANGALLETIAGASIMRARVETRTVPGATLHKEVDRLCTLIEQQTGRKPGKKQRAEIKEEAVLNLLPQAFSKFAEVLVWIDPAAKRVVIDTSSGSRSDAIVSLLVSTGEGWSITYPNTELTPCTLMSGWLMDGGPDFEEFDFGREATLDSTSEVPTKVTFTDAPLDTDEIKTYLRSGMFAATRLGLVWQGRVSFTLTESGSLRKVLMLEAARDTLGADGADGAADAFDADVAIATGELRRLIDSLFDAHGGLLPAAAS